MKQTAVNWLIKEFSEILGPISMDGMQILLMMDATDKARQMERKQNEETCLNVIERILDEVEKNGNVNSEIIFQQYYDQTYGKK